MTRRILSILEHSEAEKDPLDNQDSTVVQMAHSLNRAGTQIDLLLRGNAVNYAVRAGAIMPAVLVSAATVWPALGSDLIRLVDEGVQIFAVGDDLAERGLDAPALLPGIKMVSRASLVSLLDGYDQVWQW
jgi:sulfur transfer complex TusBCD TusB component (DsrH family)